MQDYLNLLLDAINNYNEEDMNSKNKLRDLVCIISENDSAKNDPLIRELLYTASQKMRIFGYNVQNGFYRQDAIIEQNSSELMQLRNRSILNRYRSKVRSNNILDKSQQNIIDFYQSLDKKRMLVSAPTSYGKTFIMREILYLNRERYNNVLLVFPTVALLRENALNMEELNKNSQWGYNVIKSVDGEINSQARNIFVFTPERAMQLLANYRELKIDFFFYDEMYKIDEDYCNDETDDEEDSKKNPYVEHTFLDEARAKTFRICLYILSKKVEDYYLAGPNLKKEKFGLGMQRYIAANGIQIKEVDFEPTKRIQVKAYSKKIEEDYTDLPYLEKPEQIKIHSRINDKICDVIEYIEKMGYGSTMLYCTTPSKVNEYATKLAQRHPQSSITNKRFAVFVEHLKRNYDIDHSIDEWSFVNVLEMGFGMHHGKMPKYIQKEVLDLFNEGVFDLLFCTSTIVEGVNTNAISDNYCMNGFHGLLKYEIDNARKEKYNKEGKRIKNKSIDKAYMDAFKTQKDIIEHKIPKMLVLFEAIFVYASMLKGIEVKNFSLSKVTRFYETGVKSYFGEQLVEFGFPVDAIRRIEDQNRELMSMDAEQSKGYIRSHLNNIVQDLDAYETDLLNKALPSIF